MARSNAASDHCPMPAFGSGVMLVAWMVPNGVGSGRPPANGFPPAVVWQTPQLPIAASSAPRCTSSRSNDDLSGGGLSASAGSTAQATTPAAPSTVMMRTTKRMRLHIAAGAIRGPRQSAAWAGAQRLVRGQTSEGGYWLRRGAVGRIVPRSPCPARAEGRFAISSACAAAPAGSIQLGAARAVGLAVELERFAHLRMADRFARRIGQQVLLGDVSDIGVLRILRIQVIERLVLVRPHLRRNGLIPFLGVAEDRVYVEHDAAERIHAMSHDLADLELGESHLAHAAENNPKLWRARAGSVNGRSPSTFHARPAHARNRRRGRQASSSRTSRKPRLLGGVPTAQPPARASRMKSVM